MEINKLRDHYTDYLIIQNDHATATGCSDLLSNIISHDSFTRMLSHNECASQYLWNKTKDFVREHEHNHGILSLDNSILHKPHTKVNEVITWHYDHGVGKVVKGINLLSAMVDYGKISIPVAYDVMVKDHICIKKDKNNKEIMSRKSRYSINEMARKLINQAVTNRVKFEYITGDSWFSSKDNIRFFNNNKHKFVLAISNNRLVASSRQSLQCGNHVKIKDLELKDGQSRKVYLKGISSCVVVTCKVFKNGDSTTGKLYLITNDLMLTSDHIYKVYQKRWKIEEYHRSIKQNVSVCRSPTKVKKTQLNHLCMSLLAYTELEKLKVTTCENHYALKRRMLIAANRASYKELIELQKKVLIVA